jgi:bifunctional non-homologous end joining protein LigD
VAKTEHVEVEAGEHVVKISNPNKVFFAEAGVTKLDLVNYYLSVGEGALRGVYCRPTVLKRFPNGAAEDFFFQKRVPDNRPEWMETVTVDFPSGRSATELCPTDVAHVIWAVNLGCIDLNPWPVRKWDTDHPDELRVDLDPQPGVPWEAVQEVAMCVKDVLEEHALVGYPKTSGSRGFHVNIRVEPMWDFLEVRRAALALAREVERRLPAIATSKWWKEERGDRVFIDYNQNARDRTVASVYSVRPVPKACVSAPVTWDEVPKVTLDQFTVHTMAERFQTIGDLEALLDQTAYSLQPLLDLAARDESEGMGDAPWPPHFARQKGEAKRVAPSRAKTAKQAPE